MGEKKRWKYKRKRYGEKKEKRRKDGWCEEKRYFGVRRK